jgi:hypothetical protein
LIPAVAHFVWIGRALPWAHALAITSAARCAGLSRVVLHHTDPPGEGAGWDAVAREPGVQLARLRPLPLLQRVADLGDRLAAVYRSLDTPAARANVLRVAILHGQGGVYLDTDTLTVAPLGPLLHAPAFCGLEHVVLPRAVRASRNPAVWAGVVARSMVRDLLRRLPRGYRGFARISDRFALAANNAVLGAEPGHPLLHAMLRAMVDLDPARRRVRFALGTHLLQDTIAARPGEIVLHPPEVFYPLAPEISEHWFRVRSRVDLDEVIGPATRVVHWYASVRTRAIVPRIDATYVREHRTRQLFSAAAVLATARTFPWSPGRWAPR